MHIPNQHSIQSARIAQRKMQSSSKGMTRIAFACAVLLGLIIPCNAFFLATQQTTAIHRINPGGRRIATENTKLIHSPHRRIITQRHQSNGSNTQPTLSARQQELRDELFELLDTTPANSPTSRDLTDNLLGVVRRLEDNGCPTPDEDVVAKLGGTWELLWTTQDRSSDQFNAMGPLRTFIK